MRADKQKLAEAIAQDVMEWFSIMGKPVPLKDRILAIIARYLPDEADTPRLLTLLREARVYLCDGSQYNQCNNGSWKTPADFHTDLCKRVTATLATEPVSDELNETRTCVTCGFAQQAIVHMHGGDGQPLRADGHRFAAQPADETPLRKVATEQIRDVIDGLKVCGMAGRVCGHRDDQRCFELAIDKLLDIPLSLAVSSDEWSRFTSAVEQSLADAHHEILRLQGVPAEDYAKHTWPEWSGPANTIRWAERLRAQIAAQPIEQRPKRCREHVRGLMGQRSDVCGNLLPCDDHPAQASEHSIEREDDPLRCAERSRTTGMQCLYNKRHRIPHEFERAQPIEQETKS